jgi:hypothetical protein
MRRALTALVLGLAAGALAAACDADDGGEGDPCQQAAAVRRDAIDAYCAGHVGGCCFCACWVDTGYYDIEAYLADNACLCVDPPSDDTPTACEGDLLEDAEACLDDVEACEELAAAEKELACQATPL